MKRMFLCFVWVLGFSGFISAQKGGDTLSTSSSTTLKSNSEDQTSKINKKPEGSAHLDNREIYNWNNGQQATPTGNEATGTNSGYSALRGESTKKDKKN